MVTPSPCFSSGKEKSVSAFVVFPQKRVRRNHAQRHYFRRKLQTPSRQTRDLGSLRRRNLRVRALDASESETGSLEKDKVVWRGCSSREEKLQEQ